MKLGSLKEGGRDGTLIVVSRFPNGQSPFGRVFQHGDFSHKSTLSTYKIEYLAALTGFVESRRTTGVVPAVTHISACIKWPAAPSIGPRFARIFRFFARSRVASR